MPRTDRTASPAEAGPARPGTAVRVEGEAGTQRFDRTFVIGRDPTCDVCVEGHSRVSRRHTEVRLQDGRWQVVDLHSANGTLLDGAPVQQAPLDGAATVRLGPAGPEFRVTVEGAAPVGIEPVVAKAPPRAAAAPPSEAAAPPRQPVRRDVAPPPVTPPAAGGDGEDLSLSRVVRHYFDPSDDGPAGERTQFIRQAFAQVQQKERKRYGVVIALALGVGALALGFAGWQAHRTQQLVAHAEAIFYNMREVDLRLTTQIAAGAEITPDELAAMLERRRNAARAYEGFIEELGIYRRLSEEERMIYNVARIFNESEFSIPAGFVREVQSYIRYWQRSNRFQTAARYAEEMGYTPIIVGTMRQYGLPPEFYYLAMQESNFNTRAVGPETRWGIAKGAWQFIPTTGQTYGLLPGPRAEVREFDPQDQRHDFARATDAAARYLLDIYTQLAQASGLLAFASYNWGEHRVAPRLDNLPPPGIEQARAAMAGIPMNPQDRSYWRFYTTYADRMPDETKGYVMHIFAAAVIGQNPRFFGIDIDNPLAKYLEAPLEDLLVEPFDDGPEIPGPMRESPAAPAPPADGPRRLGTDALRGSS